MCDGWVRGAEPYVRLRARAVCVRACACAWVGSFDVPWAGGACLETELHLCNSFPQPPQAPCFVPPTHPPPLSIPIILFGSFKLIF